jgi:hypothetical protein
MRKILLAFAALFGLPALYLLAIVYTAAPVTGTVAARSLDVRLGSGSRGGKKLLFDMEVRFSTPAGQQLSWKEQLPTRFVEEAVMLFDDYPPGHATTIYQHKNEAMLRRGWPDWRFGLGCGLGVFAVVFLLFSFLTQRLPKPQRMFAVMGLFPLIGGVLYYQTLQAKITTWPRVQAVVVKAPTLSLLDSRGPDLRVDAEARAFVKDAELDSIHYTYRGREYLYSGDDDVYAYSNAEHASYEKIVDPDDPSKLAEIPGEGDDTFTGAYVLLGFGVVFVLLGLLIP